LLTFILCGKQDGYIENYSPSIIELSGGARIVWVGRRTVYIEDPTKISNNQGIDLVQYQYRVVFRSADYYHFWMFGTDVNPPNINKLNDNTGYVFGWSETNGGGFVNKFAEQNLSTIKTIPNVNGKDIQISNGSSKSNMYGNIFSSQQVPYNFEVSQNFGSIPKISGGPVISSGREGVVYKKDAQFYFTLGDVMADDRSIDFVEIPDTVSINTKAMLNSCLLTKSFTLNDNSDFVYGIQCGITDTTGIGKILGDEDFINFKVELVDEFTGEVIGTFDDITYTKTNLHNYKNISYKVNTEGIGNRTVKLRLCVNDNFSPDYSLSSICSDQNLFLKSRKKEIGYQGSFVVESYDLAQNYPNPFNPSTTIKYQIPEDGMVTLKIYDILGKEVKTLINEQKATGRYEVKFDASDLASGIYLYRLSVNDFISVKKMLLLR